MNRLSQMILTHLAGAAVPLQHRNGRMPLASDSDFAEIVINRPGTDQNRHLSVPVREPAAVRAAGNEITIATTDVMNTDLIDACALRWTAWRYLRRGNFEGDQMAGDSPCRCCCGIERAGTPAFCNPNSGQFLHIPNQMRWPRAAKQAKTAIVMGEAGLWNGILIVKMPKADPLYMLAIRSTGARADGRNGNNHRSGACSIRNGWCG